MNSLNSMEFAQTLFAEVADGVLLLDGNSMHVIEANSVVEALTGAVAARNSRDAGHFVADRRFTGR